MNVMGGTLTDACGLFMGFPEADKLLGPGHTAVTDVAPVLRKASICSDVLLGNVMILVKRIVSEMILEILVKLFAASKHVN